MALVLSRRKGRSLANLVDDIFNTDRFFPSALDLDGGLLDLDNRLVVPEANIIENDKDYRIEIAAPGLERKDFNVEIQDGVLNISAEKEEEKKEDRKNYRRREFSYNSFSRSFTLPENLITDKVDAKYDNGVLRLTLPKKEVTLSKPARQIKVA